MNIKATKFDINIHGHRKVFDKLLQEDYMLHNVDIYNNIEINEKKYSAVYQTGCSYKRNDCNCPSPKLELSLDGGTDLLLFDISNDIDDDEIIDEFPDMTKQEINKIRDFLKENLKNAKEYMPDFSNDPDDYTENDRNGMCALIESDA